MILDVALAETHYGTLQVISVSGKLLACLLKSDSFLFIIGPSVLLEMLMHDVLSADAKWTFPPYKKNALSKHQVTVIVKHRKSNAVSLALLSCGKRKYPHTTQDMAILGTFLYGISFNDDSEECWEMKQTRWGLFYRKTGSTVHHHHASSDRSQKGRSSWTSSIAKALLLFFHIKLAPLQLTCGGLALTSSTFSSIITSLSFLPTNRLINSRVNESPA